MIDLGKNAAYILSAYAVSIAGLLGLLVYTFRRRG